MIDDAKILFLLTMIGVQTPSQSGSRKAELAGRQEPERGAVRNSKRDILKLLPTSTEERTRLLAGDLIKDEVEPGA